MRTRVTDFEAAGAMDFRKTCHAGRFQEQAEGPVSFSLTSLMLRADGRLQVLLCETTLSSSGHRIHKGMSLV